MFGNAKGDSPDSGNTPQRLLYSVPEVAQLLGGVTDRYVWQLIRMGALPAKLLGRRRLVAADDLTAFIDSLNDAHDTARNNAKGAA